MCRQFARHIFLIWVAVVIFAKDVVESDGSGEKENVVGDGGPPKDKNVDADKVDDKKLDDWYDKRYDRPYRPYRGPTSRYGRRDYDRPYDGPSYGRRDYPDDRRDGDRPLRDRGSNWAPRPDDRPSYGRPSYERGDDGRPYDRRDDRPSYDRRDDRPSYDRRDDRPSYDRRDDRPSYDRRDDRPSYDRRDDRPSYDRREDRPSRDDRPSYDRRDDRPSYLRRDDRRSYDRRDDRPSYDRRDDRPSYNREDDRPSYNRSTSDDRPSYDREKYNRLDNRRPSNKWTSEKEDRPDEPKEGREDDKKDGERVDEDRSYDRRGTGDRDYRRRDDRPSYGRRPPFRRRDDRPYGRRSDDRTYDRRRGDDERSRTSGETNNTSKEGFRERGGDSYRRGDRRYSGRDRDDSSTRRPWVERDSTNRRDLYVAAMREAVNVLYGQKSYVDLLRKPLKNIYAQNETSLERNSTKLLDATEKCLLGKINSLVKRSLSELTFDEMQVDPLDKEFFTKLSDHWMELKNYLLDHNPGDERQSEYMSAISQVGKANECMPQEYRVVKDMMKKMLKVLREH